MMLLTAFALLFLSQAFANDVQLPPRATFLTEPYATPHVLNISYIAEDRERLADGYIFHTPEADWTWGWGPHIYDTDGHLVFDASAVGVWMRTQDFRVCDYLGESGKHLCWHETQRDPGEPVRQRKRIFNETYEQVGIDYTKTGSGIFGPDGHEFNMLPGGRSFIQASYVHRKADLSRFRGPKEGMVHDGCFDEVAVESGDLLFSWCSMDYSSFWETQIYLEVSGQPNLTTPFAGNGEPSKPWDYVHTNSMDKNEENNYIISARHWDQILKIAGPNNSHGLEPGTIIWRLGGRSNQFAMGPNVNFSRQHHVRHISTGPTETVISLFDNAWEGISDTPSSSHSSGKVIRINNETMAAELLRAYPHPRGKLSAAQGSMHTLSNGNVLIYWGQLPEFTEYSENGTVLLSGRFHHWGWGGLEYGYRAYKFRWVGKPKWPPKLLAYSRTCTMSGSSPLVAYVSWNGATEVVSWQFHVSNSDIDSWVPAGTFAKDGFETNAILRPTQSPGITGFWSRVSVTALDKDSQVLGTASADTFMPDRTTSNVCNQYFCLEPGAAFYEYKPEKSWAHLCEKSNRYGYVLLPLTFLVVELLQYLFFLVGDWVASQPEWLDDLEDLLGWEGASDNGSSDDGISIDNMSDTSVSDMGDTTGIWHAIPTESTHLRKSFDSDFT